MYWIYFLASAACICILVIIFFKLTNGRCNSPTCLIGKTAIVTGGNSGIGYYVVVGLASRGCKVIIADKDEAEESRKRVIEHTGNKNIFYKNLDLTSFDSIRKFARDIQQNEERLDILVNNAGVGNGKNVETVDGLDKLMQTNYFGAFLLTHLLIDILKKSAPSKIIFTSSILAYSHAFRIEDLYYRRGKIIPIFTDTLHYSNSKFALFVACQEFARRLKKYGITSNALHPGFVATNLFNNYLKNLENKLVFTFLAVCDFSLKMFKKSSEEGAATVLKIALSKKYQKITGAMFMDCRPVPLLPRGSSNKKLCQEIWNVTEEIVKLSKEERISEEC